jgi:hypothetical protein
MQKKKLHHDQKQEDDSGQAGVQQILSFLQEAHPASGNEIGVETHREIGGREWLLRQTTIYAGQ